MAKGTSAMLRGFAPFRACGSAVAYRDILHSGKASMPLTKWSVAPYLRLRGSDLPARRHAQESRPVFRKDAACLLIPPSSPKTLSVDRCRLCASALARSLARQVELRRHSAHSAIVSEREDCHDLCHEAAVVRP